MAYTRKGTLLSVKKEGSSDTCYDMNEPGGHDARENTPVIERQIP